MQYSEKFLIDAYRFMKTIRVFEERLQLESKTGDIPGLVHLYLGQEAVATAMCMHLSDEDTIASTHRGHGHSIAKSCDLTAMMKEIFGKAGGICKGKGGSMHIADFDKGMLGANGIVGGAPPLALGAALSAKTLNTNNVSVVFTGDGGSNQGTTFEALNMAVVLQLPCVFVFENNGYGQGTATDYAVGSADIAGRAAGFGLPAVKVDGSDFFMLEAAAKQMIQRARDGEGPSVIEAQVTRFTGHYEGEEQRYRGDDEINDLWAGQDCLQKYKSRTLKEGWLRDEQLNDIDRDISTQIEQAVIAARADVLPDKAELLTDVYVSY